MQSLVCSWIYDSGAASSAGRCSGLFRSLSWGCTNTSTIFIRTFPLSKSHSHARVPLHLSLSPPPSPFILETCSPTLGGPCLIMPDPNGPADLQRQTVTELWILSALGGPDTSFRCLGFLSERVGLFLLLSNPLTERCFSCFRKFFCCFCCRLK